MNRCRTKFTWFIGYEQFSCHSYLESYKAYRAEKQVRQQIRSPDHFASAFDISCDFKGKVVFTKGMLKLCYTVVAKMPRRYLEWVSELQLCYGEF